MHAVFLDRDGVINENRPDHVKHWGEFRFLPAAPEAIARLTRAGVRVFVVTNQAIVARGIVSHEELEEINERMVEEIGRHGGRIEAVAYCPHLPEHDCACRKPQPGLITLLARAHGVDLGQSAVIGDALADVEAALSAGSQPILVMTGRGSEQLRMASQAYPGRFITAPDLSAAVEFLLEAMPVAV